MGKNTTVITIPNWVSWRIYNKDDDIEDTRAYVINEMIEECILLTGISAKVWQIVTESKTYNEVYEYVSSQGIEDSLHDFITQLVDIGLITLSQNKSEVVIDCVPQKRKEVNTKEAYEFIFERRNWYINNNYLAHLFIETTYNCNLNCIHCFNNKDIKPHISFKEIKPIIDDAIEIGVYKITLSGGECTLSPDFLEIAKYIRSKRIALEIYTNGQSLYNNPDLLEEIVKLYPHRICLSLYSMNPEIHDKITQAKGSHEKTLYVINKLRELNVGVRINCFLTNINFDSYIDVIEYAKKRELSVVTDALFLNNKKRNNESVQVTDEQLLKLYSDPKSLIYVQNNAWKNIDHNQNKQLCFCCSYGLSVRPDLFLYPCNVFDVKLCDLKKQSLKDIWLDKNQNSKLKQIQNLKVNNLKDCYKHDYCKFCHYCLGMGLHENGYLQKSDIACRHAKAKMEAFKNTKKLIKN